MARLIQRFASTLGASQRQNVSTLLSEGNLRSEISDFDKFKEKLVELSESVSLEATPLFKVFTQTAGRKITSAGHNYMVRLIQLDLESLFTEIDSIGKLVDVHQGVMEEKVQALQLSLSALDNRISTLELLAGEADYDLAQFNTFNAVGSTGLSRSDPAASSLYYDYRQEIGLDYTYGAEVDVRREGLILPITGSSSMSINRLEIEAGSETTESDLDVDPVDNDLSYVLVEGDGKYWVRSILILETDTFGVRKSPPEDGVKARVRVDLSGHVEFNSITLSPYTDSAFYIDQISYVDVDGGTYIILATPTQISAATTLTFSRVVGDSVYLDIRQPSYTELADFFYAGAPQDLTEIQGIMSSSGVSSLDIGGSGGKEYARGYFYTMGFDYIGVKNSDYEDTGIYVSTVLSSTTRPALAMVSANIEHSEDSTGNPLDTIEFSLAKLNYDSTGLLVSTEVLPVLYEAGDVLHEMLILDTGVGRLRFYPDLSTAKVYRDFTLLTLGTDYRLSVDGGTTYWSTLAELQADTPVGPPMRLTVEILSPKIASIYTVSYTPASAIGSDPVYLNASGTVEFNGRGIAFNYLPDQAIVRSDIYTVIILRSLDFSSTRETPVVFDYTTYIKEGS